MMQRNAEKRNLQQETNSQDSMSDTPQIPLGTSDQGNTLSDSGRPSFREEMNQRNAEKRRLQQETHSQDSMNDPTQSPLGTSDQGIII